MCKRIYHWLQEKPNQPSILHLIQATIAIASLFNNLFNIWLLFSISWLGSAKKLTADILNICGIAAKSKGRFKYHFIMYYILQNTTRGIKKVFKRGGLSLIKLTCLCHTASLFILPFTRDSKIPVLGRREECHHLQQDHWVSSLDGRQRFKPAHG